MRVAPVSLRHLDTWTVVGDHLRGGGVKGCGLAKGSHWGWALQFQKTQTIYLSLLPICGLDWGSQLLLQYRVCVKQW